MKKKKTSFEHYSEALNKLSELNKLNKIHKHMNTKEPTLYDYLVSPHTRLTDRKRAIISTYNETYDALSKPNTIGIGFWGVGTKVFKELFSIPYYIPEAIDNKEIHFYYMGQGGNFHPFDCPECCHEEPVYQWSTPSMQEVQGKLEVWFELTCMIDFMIIKGEERNKLTGLQCKSYAVRETLSNLRGISSDDFNSRFLRVALDKAANDIMKKIEANEKI